MIWRKKYSTCLDIYSPQETDFYRTGTPSHGHPTPLQCGKLANTNLSFSQTGTGAGASADILIKISGEGKAAKDFGAKGDGVTDDIRGYFRRRFNAWQEQGPIFPGTYKIPFQLPQAANFRSSRRDHFDRIGDGPTTLATQQTATSQPFAQDFGGTKGGAHDLGLINTGNL